MTTVVMESPEVYASAAAIAETELRELVLQHEVGQLRGERMHTEADKVLDQCLKTALEIEARAKEFSIA